MAATISESRNEPQPYSIHSHAFSSRARRRKSEAAKPTEQPLTGKDLYLSIYLVTKALEPTTLARLEEIGVSCLMDGRPYQAYGIITDSKTLITRIEQVPGVAFVEAEEPPCTK